MPVLKSLSFTAMPKSSSDPVHIRRAKFIEKLEEQKLLLRIYPETAEVDGQKQAVVRKQRVRPWWKMDSTGQIIMSVKFGARPIKFEKGKAGIAVPSKDKLETVINTLIEAVRAGEMDDLFASASNSRPAIGKK